MYGVDEKHKQLKGMEHENRQIKSKLDFCNIWTKDQFRLQWSSYASSWPTEREAQSLCALCGRLGPLKTEVSSINKIKRFCNYLLKVMTKVWNETIAPQSEVIYNFCKGGINLGNHLSCIFRPWHPNWSYLEYGCHFGWFPLVDQVKR